MTTVVRPVRPDEIPLIAPRLGDALCGDAPVAWGWVAVDNGMIVGHLIGTLLFATWQAADILDIWEVHLADPADRDTAVALLDQARRHAAEHGLAGVRWLEQPGGLANPLAHPSAEQKAKLRFTLTVGQGATTWGNPSSTATPASPGSSHRVD